jgi:PGF-CTERM protein
VFQVTQATTTGIAMDNKNTVSLSKNTDTTLMGNLKFKIADNAVLRFYPKVDYVIGEIGEVPTVTVTGATPVPTVTGNVTTTLTAVPTTPAVETPVTEETAKPAATTPKEPGFEAVFAIAGLLAVAYIVLRQRK